MEQEDIENDQWYISNCETVREPTKVLRSLSSCGFLSEI